MLLDVVKQRHSHLCFYILDNVIDVQMFAKKESFKPWIIENSKHLFQDKFSRNNLKLVLVCEKRFNSNIIESFMCLLKPFVK